MQIIIIKLPNKCKKSTGVQWKIEGDNNMNYSLEVHREFSIEH